MGFFDRPPREDSDTDEDPFPWFDDGRSVWVGGPLARSLVLARSDDAAVVVRHLTVFPDGLEFELSAHARRAPRDRRSRWGGMHSFLDPVEVDDDGAPAGHVLRFGLEWADGGRVTAFDRYDQSWPDATAPLHGLEGQGGSGSNSEYSWRYWAWPLPVDGPLSFVCEWPEYDISETRASIDADEVAEALSRAQPVWPHRSSGPTHQSRVGLGNAVVADAPSAADEDPD
jgi:hypothetical protein